MRTLIVPAAGKSSRYPGMRPKYLLTHPDGSLMIEKAMAGLNLDIFDRIVITIVREHVDKFDAEIILKQLFYGNAKVELCILDDFTTGPAATVFLTIKKLQIQGAVTIKDSDCYVQVLFNDNIENSVVGYNIHNLRDIYNIQNKSFLLLNEQDILSDIIEKKVVSDIISLGIYSFKDINIFNESYKHIEAHGINHEIFISHIISYILASKNEIFNVIYADDFVDFGTLDAWRIIQKKLQTYFVDLDGVLYKNSGRYGILNWSNNSLVINKNIELLKKLQNAGAQIIIVTSRTEDFRESVEDMLSKHGIKPYEVLMGLNHSARILINDFAPSNPYPSAIAINVPRDGELDGYL